MSRLVNILFALALLAALVIALDPVSRQRAAEALEDLEPALTQLDERVIVNIPSVDLSDESSNPVPSPTSFPTPVVEEEESIPVTGGENDDSSDEPFIQINWDALGDALRNLWEQIQNVEIDLNPNDNR